MEGQNYLAELGLSVERDYTLPFWDFREPENATLICWPLHYEPADGEDGYPVFHVEQYKTGKRYQIPAFQILEEPLTECIETPQVQGKKRYWLVIESIGERKTKEGGRRYQAYNIQKVSEDVE